MYKNMFVDTAEINVKAGKGGNGKVSFKRIKFKAKGGPDGGDGGDGGNVTFKVNPNMATLMDFRSKPVYKAKDGAPGGHKSMTGANGDDLIVFVPQGTLMYQVVGDEKTLIGDLTEKGQEITLAKGGRGGRGNESFKSATNQTPIQFTRGSPGEEKKFHLEIKLIADVGLVGLPNAGKSTLINQLAGTKAKVGSYPFTTLNPNLGICELKNGNKVILADLPGLIEGASKGKGLGDAFLRHVERTRLIIHLIDPFSADPSKDMVEKALNSYHSIRKELMDYGSNLEDKVEIVVVNKIDLQEVKENLDKLKKAFKSQKIEVLGISALSGEGSDALLSKITQEIEKIPEKPVFSVKTPTKVYTISDLPNKRMVFRGSVTEVVEKDLR